MILLKLMFSVEMIILELMELFFLRTKSQMISIQRESWDHKVMHLHGNMIVSVWPNVYLLMNRIMLISFFRTLEYRDIIYSWCQSSPSSTHRHAIYHKKYQTGRKHLGSLQQLVHQTTLININHSLKCATASNELCTLVNLHQSKISLCGSDESAVYSGQTLKR